MNTLKIAFLVGTLGLGGAEKQLLYMAKSLHQLGIEVRIYCLTEAEYYESSLIDMGLIPIWVGRKNNPLFRLFTLASELPHFRPHIIQSAHFYMNLYSSLLASYFNVIGIGSLRSDAINEVRGNGIWGMGLLKFPQAIISNSNLAKKNAVSLGALEDRIYILPNAIDLAEFNRNNIKNHAISLPFNKNSSRTNVLVIGNLVPEKRFDLFLRALYKARQINSSLQGYILGEGAEKIKLERMASELNLFPDGVNFLGRNANTQSILSQTDIFVLTSDHEGLPNVLLEAMAARLPVITTPAGDSAIVVKNNVTGFVVPFNDADTLASCMVNLSNSTSLRKRFGEAGRKRVEKYYNYDLLGQRLLNIYTKIGLNHGDNRLLESLKIFN